MKSIKLELLTPCFCAGFDQDKPEIRVPSIRGQLRFWTRLLYDPKHDQRSEYLLFGGIKGKLHGYEKDSVASAISLRVKTSPFRPVEGVSLCPHDSSGKKGKRNAVPAGTTFELFWHERLPHLEKRMKMFLKVIDAWCLLGSLGARQTRAAGSVWLLKYAPSISDFEARVKSLLLPSSVKVSVLGNGMENSEYLRRIATDTVIGNFDGALGYAKGRDRKASPLKLKVGRFNDGFRLIALADNRDNRGGNLSAAIDSMANKDIGKLLKNARWL